MNRISGLLKNNLLTVKQSRMLHGSLMPGYTRIKSASVKIAETAGKLNEIASRMKDSSNADTANQNAVTYSKNSRKGASYLPGRKTVSLVELEDAFASAKKSNQKAIENAGSKITAGNQDKYTGVGNVINSLNTHFLTDEYYFNGRVAEAEKTAFDRKMVSCQINNILREHNIELPSDFSCEFSIDPDDYRITVENCGDMELKNRLEQALNDGDDKTDFADRNGRNLYNHIYLSGKDYSNSQISGEGQLKRHINDLVWEKTGINLKDCKNTGDDFITADGQSVKELFLQQVEKEEKTEENIKAFKDLRASYLSQAKDFDYTDDNKQVLRIAFSNGALHDIGQDENFGGDLGFITELSNAAGRNDSRKTFTCFV